jgi:hypothetical protein
MPSKLDFEYAIENTKVHVPPKRRIATFGTTSFDFLLVTELMDSVDRIRIRNGRIHADRPEVLTPEHLSRLVLEGFSSEANEFADWIRTHGNRFAFLKYGFRVSKSDLNEHLVHDRLDVVIDRLRADVESTPDHSRSLIQGVDESWEICLLKFTFDLVQSSAGENLGDFRKGGWI